MSKTKKLFDFHWDVDKYKANYDPEHWDLCRTFMLTHKTKYPEQKLVHLTEAFYQIGVYGSSYDPKTTRMVSALTVEVLDDFLESHPNTVRHPFKKSTVIVPEVVDITDDLSDKGDSGEVKVSNQPSSIWDVAVDQNIITNVLVQSQLKELLKGFVIIYDVRKISTMNDNKISILEESFKRSKFGPCHWDKEDIQNNICPIRLTLKWKGTILAEAVGTEIKALRTRVAQALLSKIANFSPGIEAKWSYYRDGKMPDLFDRPNPRKSSIYRIMPRSQFKAMAEITSFIDTFANSDSFAEIIFGMDFSSQEKKQIMDYVNKSWGTKLTYRTLSKMGVKSRTETHVCLYQIRTGEEMRRWLDQCGGDNERYRLIPPGQHRRAGSCDNNVREVLTTDSADLKVDPSKSSAENQKDNKTLANEAKPNENKQANNKTEVKSQNLKDNKNEGNKKEVAVNKEEVAKISGEATADDLEKLLEGFVLFYDAKKNSEIDKDDWFSALRDSFRMSKFGPLEVICENIRPLRVRCIFKWKDITIASAEGLTETQARTGATLQLISKMESFTYIIQAKEEYFCGGNVPPFIENPDPSKSDVYSVVRRQDLPSYYSIFQFIDEFLKNPCYGEIVFGVDFTWELKNEIVVYLKAKDLDYRYFTLGDQKPWTHMAVYHTIKPEDLKNHLLLVGGENEKYKLIPPPKAEMASEKTAGVDASKVSEKQTVKPPPIKVVEKTAKPALTKVAEKAEKVVLSKVAEKSGPAKVGNAEKATPAKVVEKIAPPVVGEKRKIPAKEPPAVDEAEVNKIQINLKKFKKQEVEYPEDTGGDFPGLILWIGIKKNSMWQKNLFVILIESFKMSKYGELLVEEHDETVWGRKEPMKKCVVKSNRKVLAIGLGDTKTEAKNSASLQILRDLRKHCYTIQAKESYFKEGKATPYNFNPDPAKNHVYRLAKREKLKDRAAIIRYVDNFSRNICSEEVIFGDDFSYDEREYILHHCRQINVNYRLMKCQSTCKGMHTHIAIYHQRPLPAIKAALIKSGGENDMFRLIPPGGKITYQDNKSNTNDMWPESLEPKDLANKTSLVSVPAQASNQDLVNGQLNRSVQQPVNFNTNGNNVQPQVTSVQHPIKTTYDLKDKGTLRKADQMGANSNSEKQGFLENQSLHSVPLGPQPINPIPSYTPVYQQGTFQEIPFGPQPFNIMQGQPLLDLPLSFGPQPVMYIPMSGGVQSSTMVGSDTFGFQPSNIQVGGTNQPATLSAQVTGGTMAPQETTSNPVLLSSAEKNQSKPSKEGDLRDELAKKRHSESHRKKTPERKVYDTTGRKILKKDDSKSENWSRKVFVNEPKGSSSGDRSKDRSSDRPSQSNLGEKPVDLREKLRQKELPRDKAGQRESRERVRRRISPENNRRRMSPENIRPRMSPGRNHRRISPPRRFSPGRDRDRLSPDRRLRGSSRERFRAMGSFGEERIITERDNSFERRIIIDESRSRRDLSRDRNNWSPRSRSARRSPIHYRDEDRIPRPSPMKRFRDLWDNISLHYSESIFMYKYVKQDSTTETDPFALLRATRSLSFNVDFDFISTETNREEWQVCVELVTDDTTTHPLVGEGVAATQQEARLIAAHHAVDSIQKACRVIEPMYGYFAGGGVPEFISRGPMKTSVYEIIQNLDPSKPLDRYTCEVMFGMFHSSELEDMFFLATSFSYLERVLVIEMANQMNLWWRLFGPRHPEARPDDIVSTQHVCVYKQKSALQLVRELLANGGSTEKYRLVDPRESRITQPEWDSRGFQR